jgi:mannose-6-phosphate isomerase-like protein (cupin superfamily)
MLIRNLKDCAEFISGDGCVLREILHPDKMELKLGYSLAHAIVHPGDITLPHRLKTSEVYYIIEGEGVMHIDEESALVRAGATIYIPPMAVQFIQNSGKMALVFLAIVDPAWRVEDEEVLTEGCL